MKTRMMLALGLLLALLMMMLPTPALAGDSVPPKGDGVVTGETHPGKPVKAQLRDITWGKQRLVKAYGTDVTHSINDSGYTAPIHVVCAGSGTHRWLYRGDRTAIGSPNTSCGYAGVQWIVAHDGQAVRCFNQLPPYGSHYFIGGYREPPSWASLDCYMQRPI